MSEILYLRGQGNLKFEIFVISVANHFCSLRNKRCCVDLCHVSKMVICSEFHHNLCLSDF